jgi:hypothetical protein
MLGAISPDRAALASPRHTVLPSVGRGMLEAALML